MNINLIQTLTSRIPGVLSGVPTLSQITSETALSIENFNSELTAWRQRAETMEQSAGYMNDPEWLYEHRADEIADAAQQLRFDQFELVRKLIAIHRQRAGLLDMMSIDLQAAETDAAKKLETAKSKAERDLSKILPNTGPREKVLFQQAVNQAESVQAAAGKLREARGLLSSVNEMRRPLDDNDVKLREMLVESVRDLIK